MEISLNWVTCDGCGLPASPAHIAERVHRLELATRYRPIHISVLFVAAAPLPHPEDDFYAPPKSWQFFDTFMEAVDLLPSGIIPPPGEERHEGDAARLIELQRRGYYLTYLSECPVAGEDASSAAAIPRLGATLARRIRFNYKPRQTVILGRELSPLREVLERAGVPDDSVSIVEVPAPGDIAHAGQFRSAFRKLANSDSGSI
jgi:hypothetical protein